MSFSLTRKLTQIDKYQIPQLGFGVWDSPRDKTVASILRALKVGYRHIDTAQMYGNEREVGEAVKQSGLPREEVYVTTKMLSAGNGPDDTYAKLKASVDRIGLGYVDLFLIHSASQSGGAKDRKLLWSQLERLKQEGLARSIGVSNYGVKHLEEMDQKPAVNQIELHPFCQQRPVVEYCQKHGIVVEAYCPIMRARNFDNPTIQEIAQAHKITPAQVVLRWSIQKGFVPLPKSDNPERIQSNVDLFGFSLTQSEMSKLDALDKGATGAVAGSNAAVDGP